VDFHTLHNVLHYLYTNQITFHSKPGKEPRTGPRTVDAQSVYEAADRFLLPSLKYKALYFLRHSCNIQNVTGRMFGEFARTHEELDAVYSCFFGRRLRLIVQTFEFEDFFERLESSDADRINMRFRKAIQKFLCKKKLVGSHQNTSSTYIEIEDEDEDDSADSDYEPDDNQEEEEKEDDDQGDEIESSEIESSEESSDEEEEQVG
jgi:hypothetical protein